MIEAKVVRVIARLNVGGPAIHVINLSAGLRETFPTILVAGQVDSSEADMRDQMSVEGVHLQSLPELGRRISPWQDLVAFVKLYRLFRKERPEIVHTHTAKAGTLGRLAAALSGVPVRVHTYHGHVMRGYFSPLMNRLVIAVERFLGRLTTKLVTVSDLQARELVTEIGVCPPEKMQVISLGFDLGRFDAARLEQVRGEFRQEIGAGEAPIVTVVGRLVPIKNHELLLRSMALLAREGEPFVLAIVGGGPDEGALRAKAEDLGLGRQVRFLGWRSDLDRIYADSTVVALSSINEGTPVCLIEALAAGCAVVATDVGGVRDVLENGGVGVIVPSGDEAALGSGIRSLLHDSAKREALGSSGATSVRDRFAVERLLSDMSGLYLELLEEKGLRRPGSVSPAYSTSCTT